MSAPVPPPELQAILALCDHVAFRKGCTSCAIRAQECAAYLIREADDINL